MSPEKPSPQLDMFPREPGMKKPEKAIAKDAPEVGIEEGVEKPTRRLVVGDVPSNTYVYDNDHEGDPWSR